MSKKIKVFVVAGEASGDFLGARLIAALRNKYPNSNLIIKGIGGDLMKREGVYGSFAITQLATVGIIEIIPKIFEGLKLLKTTAEEIRKFKPDVLITIDMPSFSLRLVKIVSDLKKIYRTKFIHYVSPTVWAYKEWRIKYMEKYYDLVLAIFPFEPDYYKSSSLACKYVGHPVSEYGFEEGRGDEFRKQNKIPHNKNILGIMPGSRVGEVKRMLPIFIDAVNMFIANNKSDLLIVFPVISQEINQIIESFKTRMFFDYLIVQPSNISDKINVFSSFSFALVKSGTSSHELVFANVPMVVAYKTNVITYLIAKYWFRIQDKVKFITLANLLVDREIIPEYIQDRCNPHDLCDAILKLHDKGFQEHQRREYEKVSQLLSSPTSFTPSENAASYCSYFLI